MNYPRSFIITKHLLNTLLAMLMLSFSAVHAAAATTVDIMLVYDTTATTWVSSNGGMAAFSQDAVNRMNQAAQNSNIDLTFRLVHSVSVNYTHQSFDNDLDALTDGTGGFANIHSLRDNYGADLVALLIDTGSPYGTTGLGWVLTSYSGSPGYAFTVSAIQSVEISQTLTHEVGHNMGAQHSKSQKSNPGPNTYLNNPKALHSAGWYFTGTNNVDYHTIMAYNSDGYGNFYQSAPLFSTPLLTYKGTVAGDAQDGDNSRLIRDTIDAIAGYRDAIGSLTVTIEPQEARTEGAQWRRAGTAIWHDSGVVEEDLLSGQYQVEFKTVDGWEEPADITVDVYAGQTTAESGTYSPVYEPVGSLSVTIEPQAARTDGAQWRRTGTATWYDSGYVEEYLPVGQYIIEFKAVEGWDKPNDVTVDVYDGQTATAGGTYSIIYTPVGAISVTILPQDAVTAGAQWRREGTITWFDSGDTESNVDPGQHVIEFKPLNGWKIPDSITVDVYDTQTALANATYVLETPVQQPTTTPFVPLLLLSN